MEVQVEILIQTITSQYGTLNQGDLLRTGAAFAAHLVHDCGAAKYCEPQPTPQALPAVETPVHELAASSDGVVQTSAQQEVAPLPAGGVEAGGTSRKRKSTAIKEG